MESCRSRPGRLVGADGRHRSSRAASDLLVSFIVLTMFLIVALDRRPTLLAVGVGVGLAVSFHLIFVVALDVSLPKAFWGF